MSTRAPLPEVPTQLERGPVLVFAPHPDDDVIGAGGSAALHAAQGDPVRVVVVFDGRAGDVSGGAEPDYTLRRQGECLAGGAHLGLTDYEFWGYPEGHEPGPAERETAEARIAALVHEFRPATVYAPWIGEHHLDHHVLARTVRRGLARADYSGLAWGYEVWSPLVASRIVDISAVREAKRAALAEHTSQLEATGQLLAILGINEHRSIYLPRGATAGEAFCPLLETPPDEEPVSR